MSRRTLMTTTYSGKSLETIFAEMTEHMDKATTAGTIDDTMTALGYYDPFARVAIKRAFMVTLKEGGSNERLTTEKKWLRGREKWADGLVDSGKPTLKFEKVTVPTTDLTNLVVSLNGDISEAARTAVGNIVATITDRSNAKLDKNSVAFLAEDVGTLISENAALARDCAIHESYRADQKKAMDMMQELISKIPGGRNGNSVARS